jgi:transmembrane sensor
VCAGIFLAIAAGLAPWWGFSWWQFHSVETYITQVGEQLRVPLSDGSVAILDTNTIVNVEFGGVIREVELVRGRVYFDVAPNHERPFIVRVDARRVVALGTAFDVQRGNDSLRVVLVRGRIAVERNNSTFDPGAIELASPGEFATLTEDGELERGQLELGKATAWQSGRIVFKEDSLRDAVAEMNRYSRQPIALGDATVGDLLISAVYEVSNADSFAKSLSMLLPVSVTYEEGIAVLRRSPEENSTPPR